MSGTTAITAAVHNAEVFVANIGDSRAIIGAPCTRRAFGRE